MTGIVGYGVYVPRYRIKVADIASVWKKDPDEITNGLKVVQKAVPNDDEDAVTMGVEAARNALDMSGLAPSKLQAVFVGSESHPYVVNPTSTTIADFLGVGRLFSAADFEFACKAATAAMQLTASFVENKSIDYGLIIGSDTAQAKPHDPLEYTAASAAAAYILGNKQDEIIAKITGSLSFSSDTPDFWRREGMKFPSHAGRFTGEPAYFAHVMGAAKALFSKTGTKPSDFDYCVFHMPNGKFPRVVAKELGFTPQQLAPSLIVDEIGNPYSASALTGLAAVLDVAKPGSRIFFASYGSGAGSDAFVFETTRNILEKQKKARTFASFCKNTEYISYIDFLRKTYLHLL
ncbi:MAG: hydroxymethylglutaryl-CoA synthase [Candidatus Levybacteria bacterium]|nr:hydroxymethylglutaryl-CoA synthase [Candidatus Levybacteria bacterium]